MLRIETGSGDGNRATNKENGSERAVHDFKPEHGGGLSSEYSDTVVANAKKLTPTTGPQDAETGDASGSSTGEFAQDKTKPLTLSDGKEGKQASLDGVGERAKSSGSSTQSDGGALSGADKIKSNGVHHAFPSSTELLKGLKV